MEQKKKMEYLHLGAADGVRRETAKLLQPALGEHTSKLDVQLLQKAHGTINLEVKEEVAPKIKKRELNTDDLPALKELGWTAPYLPKCYFWPDSTKKRIYIAGEFPDHFLALDPDKKQKAIEEWGQLLLHLTFDYNKQDVSINQNIDPVNPQKSKEMNKLKATVFESPLTCVKEAAVTLNDEGSVFFQIGDAARSPNFYLAHGANDAMDDGRRLAECLEENGFNTQAFNENHNRKKRMIISGTKAILDEKLSFLRQREEFCRKETQALLSDITDFIKKSIPSGRERKIVLKAFDKLSQDLEVNYDNNFLKNFNQACNGVIQLFDDREKFGNFTDKFLEFFSERMAIFGDKIKFGLKQSADEKIKQRTSKRNKLPNHTKSRNEFMEKAEKGDKLLTLFENTKRSVEKHQKERNKDLDQQSKHRPPYGGSPK